MAARARRPRKTDCDPSTDFNLCACEREYSIEAARRSRFCSSSPVGSRRIAYSALEYDALLGASPDRNRSALDLKGHFILGHLVDWQNRPCSGPATEAK